MAPKGRVLLYLVKIQILVWANETEYKPVLTFNLFSEVKTK